MSRLNETSVLSVEGRDYAYYPISACEGAESLPYSLKVLLENVLRNAHSAEEAETFARRIVEAGTEGRAGDEVEFAPARVLFQDFTGVPVFVDFAVMREACAELGGDPAKINPQVPCDLVIDHSVIADQFGCAEALAANAKLEYERNAERYSFLKWAQGSFENVRIVPPGQGICHQLNIENFSSVVFVDDGPAGEAASADGQSPDAGVSGGLPVAYFDTLVGTDSHTPTANGIGVLGWGVGGIEAEAAALGQPITILVPPVVGVKLTGELPGGTSAMDLALAFAQKLRARGVVGKFVECFGPGVAALSATQRACVSNMTPEYGSTCTLFPVDDATIDFLRMTGRPQGQVALVEAYAKAQGLWREDGAARAYSEVIEIDLGEIAPSMSGPSRPHDRFDIADCRSRFQAVCADRGLDASDSAQVALSGTSYDLGHGAIVIAAVTSCTTATDPRMMLACGILAKKAADAGLRPKPWVKTVFAPGSHATELLLERAGLLGSLRELGFATCGFGCMSCIGNSGPVLPEIHGVCDRIELASVLSGNRNFEGRISADVAQNYLMSPAAVVAYALAGTVDFDPSADPLGEDAQGRPVLLADLWPSADEVEAYAQRYVTQDLYAAGSEGLYAGDAAWQALEVGQGDVFSWDDASTYVRKAPYFEGMGVNPEAPEPIEGARVLALLGDFITTDHISPAGAFAAETPAGRYLAERGVDVADFNTYGSRRGNHEVMMRGTFANVKLANALAGGRKGGWTTDFLAGETVTVFEAAQHYAAADVPAIVVAGKMYGSGSSRDWAAKGPALLGVRAAIAESFERIHRSNLIGMGILPLQFAEGDSAESLGIDGSEEFAIGAIDFSAGLPNPSTVEVTALKPGGKTLRFTAQVRIDTPTEGLYYAHGGILQYVIRSLIGA